MWRNEGRQSIGSPEALFAPAENTGGGGKDNQTANNVFGGEVHFFVRQARDASPAGVNPCRKGNGRERKAARGKRASAQRPQKIPLENGGLLKGLGGKNVPKERVRARKGPTLQKKKSVLANARAQRSPDQCGEKNANA